MIGWSVETRWSEFFPSRTARPASSPRLIAGLLYLQHTFACSDEDLIQTWVENPSWQHFCGETYLQHEPPIDPSSLTLWHQRMGEEGVKRLLEQRPKDKNKLYSLHAQKVECIGKGKARHSYDGHALTVAIELVNILTHRTPKAVFVDKAYRGVSVDSLTIWRSGQRRRLTPSIRKAVHRR